MKNSGLEKEHVVIDETSLPEYQMFLEAADDGAFHSTRTSHVAERISRDLVSSPRSIGIKYTILVIVGFFLSLLICAQGNIGLGAVSFKIFEEVMSFIPPKFCGIVCGTIFSGVPFFFSLIVLNRFEQRYLLFRMWWLVLLLPILGAVCMQFYGNVMRDADDFMWGWASSWTIAAVMTPYVFETVLYVFALKQRTLKTSST
ncbi:MAG: hypothetical protein RIR26_2741 [Pseudomonadota bacterium]